MALTMFAIAFTASENEKKKKIRKQFDWWLCMWQILFFHIFFMVFMRSICRDVWQCEAIVREEPQKVKNKRTTTTISFSSSKNGAK